MLYFAHSQLPFRVRAVDLTAKKEYLYVFFVFFVVKEFFMGLPISGRRKGASAFAVPMPDSRLHTLPRRLRAKPKFCDGRD